MHILITGATGLIGRRLTQRLLALSHSVSVLTRDVARARGLFGEHVDYWPSLQDKPSSTALTRSLIWPANRSPINAGAKRRRRACATAAGI